jgi:pimeloyl-ACP methyl ester carboxylesterase
MADRTVTPLIAPRSIPGISSNTRLLLQRFYQAATWLDPKLAAHLALTLFMVPARAQPHAADREVLARSRQSRLRVGSGWVQVYEWGPEERPTTFLMHGWSSCGARLTSFVQPLLDAGFRVLAIDAPGHGASSGLRSNLACFVHAIRVVLERRGPIEGIVAHSYGALATLRLLMKQPTVKSGGVVLVGMPPDVQYMMEQFKLVLALRADVQLLLHSLFVQTFGQAPDSYSPGLCSGLPGVPTLVVHDEDDDVAPIDHARVLAGLLPAAEFLRTQGLNHSGPLRDPATIGTITAFLKRKCQEAKPAAQEALLPPPALTL